MNRIFYIQLIVILLFGCTQSKENKHEKEQLRDVKTTINQIVDDWHQAAEQSNYEAYMDAMDSASIFIGTDATENWTKQQFEEFSKPFFDKGTAWDFDPLERNIYISNSQDVVWFDEVLNTWMGVCRGSGVLQKINNEWKIEHYVLSVDIPNDDVQAVITAKQQNDSLFLQKYKVPPK